jgi:endonuclease/exonuclease/phosphatase family metal-dependent hydrolase
LIVTGHDNGLTVFSQIPDTRTQTIRLVTRNAVSVTVGGINIFSIYLDDVSEETRIKQIEAALKLVNPNTPILITGDLNTIDPNDLAETNIKIAELARKFPELVKNKENSLNEMKRGEVTRLLISRGFSDLGKEAGNTYPAKLFPLLVDAPIARFDYAFGSSQIKPEEFKVLTDAKYGNLSDHYPIWLRVSSL